MRRTRGTGRIARRPRSRPDGAAGLAAGELVRVRLGAAQTYAWAAMHPEMVPRPRRSPARRAPRTTTRSSSPACAARSRPTATSTTASTPTSRRSAASRCSPRSTPAGGSPSRSSARRCSRFFGASDVEQFIDIFWDAFYVKCDANDLLAQIWTWWHNDLGDHPSFGGDFEPALGAHPGPHDHPQRRRSTSTSRPSTATTRRRTSRTPSRARSPASGATWRRSTPRTRRSSTAALNELLDGEQAR